MKIENGKVFPIEIIGEGTVMDYVENEFVFIIKDASWTTFELEALSNHTLEVDFVYKFDIAVFLLTLEDAIDTSDFIFNVYDNEYEETLWRTFEKGIGYGCVLYLLDHENIVRGSRKVQLSSLMSNIIASKLKEQKARTYNEEEFSCNLLGLQNTFEPFELQPMALASEKFK